MLLPGTSSRSPGSGSHDSPSSLTALRIEFCTPCDPGQHS